jgi:hypothetical protein
VAATERKSFADNLSKAGWSLGCRIYRKLSYNPLGIDWWQTYKQVAPDGAFHPSLCWIGFQ